MAEVIVGQGVDAEDGYTDAPYVDPIETLSRDSRTLARALTMLGSYSDGLEPPDSHEELIAREPLISTVRDLRRMLRERPDAIAIATALGSLIDDPQLIQPAPAPPDSAGPTLSATLRLSVVAHGAELPIHEEIYSIAGYSAAVANDVITRTRRALLDLLSGAMVTYHPGQKKNVKG